jgi:hypothetical protein
MIGTNRPAVRISGSGDRLRLHVAQSPDSLATVRECCRAATAVDKALGEAIRGAIAAGHSWHEVGQALSASQASTSAEVLEDYADARQWSWRRFWGLSQGEE